MVSDKCSSTLASMKSKPSMLLGHKVPNPRWCLQDEKIILSVQPLTDANYYICYSYIFRLRKVFKLKKKWKIVVVVFIVFFY